MGGRSVPEQVEDDDLHDLVEVCLRRVDQRYTAGRRAIVEFLAAHGHPVSISDIAARASRGAEELGLPAPRRPSGRGGRPAHCRQVTNSHDSSSPRI